MARAVYELLNDAQWRFEMKSSYLVSYKGLIYSLLLSCSSSTGAVPLAPSVSAGLVVAALTEISRILVLFRWDKATMSSTSAWRSIFYCNWGTLFCTVVQLECFSTRTESCVIWAFSGPTTHWITQRAVFTMCGLQQRQVLPLSFKFVLEMQAAELLSWFHLSKSISDEPVVQ